MYFRITNSHDAKIVGQGNQQFEEAEYPIHIEDPRFLGNTKYYLKKVNIDDTIPAFPILKNEAKVTDLINGTWYGVPGRLLISTKLKILLAKENHPGLQFVKTHITHKRIIYDNYYFSNPFLCDLDDVNFNHSVIFINGSGGKELREITVTSLNDFQKIADNLVLPERIYIKKLVINKDVNKNLLILRGVYGGISYYISEKLKREIQHAGCTGIEFEPVDEA